MLKLKLQYFDHLMQRAESLEKTLVLGKISCKRRRSWPRMRGLISTDSMAMTLGKIWEKVFEDRGACCPALQGVTKSWMRLRG